MILPTKIPADELEDSLPLATDEQILVKLCDRDSIMFSDTEGKGSNGLKLHARMLATALAAAFAGSCGVYPPPQCVGWNTSEYFQSADAEVVGRCLTLGMKSNAVDADGRTPLHFAVISNTNPGMIDALVDAGADIDSRAGRFNESALHLAAGSGGNEVSVAALIRRGADPNSRDAVNWTPLHRAAIENTTVSVIQALIEGGADPNARADNGWTPLHRAAPESDNPLVFEALVKGGGIPDSKDELGRTALHWAAAYAENSEVIGELAELGANVNASDRHGWTPLHFAAFFADDPEIVHSLRSVGADPTLRSVNGNTAYELVDARETEPSWKGSAIYWWLRIGRIETS